MTAPQQPSRPHPHPPYAQRPDARRSYEKPPHAQPLSPMQPQERYRHPAHQRQLPQVAPLQPQPNQSRPNQSRPNQARPNQSQLSQRHPHQRQPSGFQPNQFQPSQRQSDQPQSQPRHRRATLQEPPDQRRGDHPSAPRRPRFGALAWSAVILGIIGVVGSPIIFLNNVTAVVAAVGVILGVIALFGTRKILAGIGVVLCVAAITFTVLAQGAAVAELDRRFGALGGDDPAALQDVSVRDCAVVDKGYGLVLAEGTIEITNSTAESQTYSVTVSVNDATGARVGEINALANSLAPGQSVVLSGTDASGTATEQASPGPVACQVADVNRFGG